MWDKPGDQGAKRLFLGVSFLRTNSFAGGIEGRVIVHCRLKVANPAYISVPGFVYCSIGRDNKMYDRWGVGSAIVYLSIC